ncbi:Di-copper centre-containing protein [Periconia macrospinosa]|uniref:tyrosinase n=1 Tax=Periconia macrospinosa TaxID=97972 RepID=A0A2V1EB40_9PLEO|nr:Di-copper centre-containing protein [Periconia macrospinosa]
MVVLPSIAVVTAISTTLLSLASASPVGPEKSIKARQNSYYVLQPVTDGGVQPRMDIRELERNPAYKEVWTLFLLAVERLKAVDQQNKTSFYQVAGIHGRPVVSWDGLPPWTTSTDAQMGYCPHGGQLFAMWHRPYLMLYEKLLHDQALAIVNEIKDATVKAKWRTAASKLRLPYWDWALKAPAGEHLMPTSIADETIPITFPNGTTKSISNPLFKYTFHPLIPSDFALPGEELYYPYDKWKSTLRNPTQPDNDVNAVSNKTEMHLWFDESRDSLARGVYRVMSQWQGWGNFSTAAYTDPRSQTQIGDIESKHGPGHTLFANGHMSPSQYTAFDPVFWLHHANVDRYIAIWQAVYPTTWMTRDVQYNQVTFSFDASLPSDGNTPLTPFHSDNKGGFWTSNTVRDTTKLGYTYPELVGNPSNDTIKSRITANWGNTPAAPWRLARRDEDGKRTTTEYIAVVSLVPGFIVEVGIGKTETTRAGAFSTKFSQIKSAMTGLIELTPVLDGKAKSGSLVKTDEASVIEYLKSEFSYVIKNERGQEVKPAEVPDLVITVISQVLTVPESDTEFPQIVSGKEHPEITGL